MQTLSPSVPQKKKMSAAFLFIPLAIFLFSVILLLVSVVSLVKFATAEPYDLSKEVVIKSKEKLSICYEEYYGSQWDSPRADRRFIFTDKNTGKTFQSQSSAGNFSITINNRSFLVIGRVELPEGTYSVSVAGNAGKIPINRFVGMAGVSSFILGILGMVFGFLFLIAAVIVFIIFLIIRVISGKPVATFVPPANIPKFCPHCGKPLAPAPGYMTLPPICPACRQPTR